MKPIGNLYLVETDDERILYVSGTGQSVGTVGGDSVTVTAPIITVT
jgi:hypothetical protein